MCVLSRFNRVRLFATLWTIAHQTLLFMDSPGKNTGVDGHALLQGIFLTQGSNPRLYVCCIGRWFFYRERHLGSPIVKVQFSSVQFSRSVVSDSLQPHESQHARPPCPSPTPGVNPTHVHRVSDAIQPSHPLSSPSCLKNKQIMK